MADTIYQSKKEKSKKVCISGTRDRLFVVRNITDDGWALVDRRGNYYENKKDPNEITKHIDEFVEQGKYKLQ